MTAITHVKCSNRVSCNADVAVGFDPRDFTYRTFCPPCRKKRRTHNLAPFCNHGNNLLRPLDQSASCKCTYDEVIDTAVWDWVPRLRDIFPPDS